MHDSYFGIEQNLYYYIGIFSQSYATVPSCLLFQYIFA